MTLREIGLASLTVKEVHTRYSRQRAAESEDHDRQQRVGPSSTGSFGAEQLASGTNDR